ncbi:MAG: HipA domain-containing protein, partial [Betaproteobacteria bacterium]|nr:HipA domain-containing protein [Betaproteobacteria bacterium]
MSATLLVIWCERARLGELTTDRGIWQFRCRYPLSPHFPLRAEPFVDTSDERPVQWFFDNLLPEGGVRQALAQLARLAANDGFGLLARFGEESAGALTLLSTEAPPPAEGRYESLSLDELRELIRKQPGIPLIAADGRAKMSLAGAQHKLPLHWDGAQFWLPQGAPSTHILKPENARPEHYPFCPANEHFCMSLARSIGLPAPDTELMHLPEPVYLVRRYDRVTADQQTRRLHQIDLCQLLNKWPEYKFEAQGGTTFREAYLALA